MTESKHWTRQGFNKIVGPHREPAANVVVAFATFDNGYEAMRDKAVECVNAMEPGGKVDRLVQAAREVLDVAGGATAINESSKPSPALKALRAALAEFNGDDS